MVLYFFMFFLASCLNWAFSEQPSWDTSESAKRIQSIHAIQNLQNREHCGSSSSASILGIHEVLEIAAQKKREEFICEIKEDIKGQNQLVMGDREFMLNYIKTRKENPESLSEEDHIRMAEKMIKYRMLRDKEWKEYYVPSTRYTPPEVVKEKIAKLAREYVENYGPPNACFFIKRNIVKRKKLTNKTCYNEILYKVQTIPSPLILTQAALESGWGGSDLAEEHNNILGLQVRFTDPSSMSEYPNCRRAEKDPKRCLLKFSGYEGSVYEYFARFNGSHLKGYQRYRRHRLDLYNKNEDHDECRKSDALTKSIDFYAENKMYVKEIRGMMKKICSLSKNCESGVVTAENKN